MASAIVTAIFAWIALQLLAAVLRYGFKVKELVLGWFSISIQSAGLNRSFYTLGRRHSNELRQWFGLGVLVAGMLGVSAVVILIRELWRAIHWADQASMVGGASSNTWELEFAVPGLTVPWNHAIYIWLAAAVSICVHEAGHALAAAAEGVGLHHVAAFTVFLLPGAYIALDNETMAILSPWRTLRIVCGGVWHNAVLCMFCWLVAFMLPFLLLPAYSTGKGAVVRVVLEDSPLAYHLHPADVITRVDHCQVRNGAEWLGCMAQLPGVRDDSILSDFDGSVTANHLLEIMGHPATKPGGYCIPHELQAHSRVCSSETNCSANELCFREWRPRGRKLSDETAGPRAAGRSLRAPRHFAYGARRKGENEKDSALAGGEASENNAGVGRELTAGTQGENQRICIRAREAVGSQPCSISGRLAERAGGRCPSMSTCHLPILPAGEELLKVCYRKGFNTIASHDHEWGADWQHIHRRLSSHNTTSARSLLQVLDRSSGGAAAYRQNADYDKSCPDFLVFVGSRGSLLQAVEVTDYCPAAWWVPMRLPYMIEQLLAYMFAVSAALALLNMAPVYGLDGQAALKSLLLLGEPRDPFYRASRMRGSLRVGRELVRHCIMNVCTSIFALLLMLQVLRLTGYDIVLMRLLAAVRHLLKFSVRWG